MYLKKDGSVEITGGQISVSGGLNINGQLTVNGQPYAPCAC